MTSRLKTSKQEVVSYKMSRVKAKGTSIEKIMGSCLWSAGFRGYRKNLKGVVGTPDFCWKKQKIAVFCDSSFWHGYNWSERKKDIKVRKAFWLRKIEDNIRRDKRVTARLKQEGWKILRFWDFEIKRNASACVDKIAAVSFVGQAWRSLLDKSSYFPPPRQETKITRTLMVKEIGCLYMGDQI